MLPIEIAHGCQKEVIIERNEPCPECGGKGAKNASDIETCPVCHGSGQEQRVTSSFFGQTVTYTTCSRCGGEGRIVKNPCRNCSGTGLVRKRVTVKVNIPAGVENGMQITQRGEGHAAKNGGVNGDLLIIIEELPTRTSFVTATTSSTRRPSPSLTPSSEQKSQSPASTDHTGSKLNPEPSQALSSACAVKDCLQ